MTSAPVIAPSVARDDRVPGASLRRPSALVLLAGLYVVASAVYVVLSLRSPLPVLSPDEFRYSHLARSLADGQGFEWRGEHVGQSAALYVYFITPVWALFHSTVDAYHASKVLGTLALCAQVVPVWLLGRELIGSRLALLPALLSVAGTWMLTSAETATEALGYPLATAALCLMVMALRRPGSRLGVLAFVFLLLAVWARIQLAVFVPAMLAAFAIDALRCPGGRRARLRAHRPYLVVGGVGVVVLAILALAAPSLTGDYAGYFGLRPPLGAIVRKSGLQLLELLVAAGFVPVALASAAALSGRAWRDDRTGPLLAVFWPAALATVLQSGFFLAGYPPATGGIQRYVTYAVPLVLVLMTVLAVEPRLVSRRALAVTGALMLGLLARPAIAMIGEERATWATSFRVDQLLGLPIGAALTLVALLLLGVAVLVRRRVEDPVRAAAILTAVLCAVFGLQGQANWHHMVRTMQSFRQTLPADLEWVDHHARGPVALLGVTENAPRFEDLDFFNRKISQAYGPAGGLSGRPIEGRVCSFQILQAGALDVQPDCGPIPHRFLINDPSAHITFYDEIVSATDPHIGRLVEVAPGAVPRVQSLIVVPCPRPVPTYSLTRPGIQPADAPVTCRASLAVDLWLGAPAQVVIRYRGGRRPQTVTLGRHSRRLPPGQVTTIRLRAPLGFSTFSLRHDWTSSAGTPDVIAAELDHYGRTTSLL